MLITILSCVGGLIAGGVTGSIFERLTNKLEDDAMLRLNIGILALCISLGVFIPEIGGARWGFLIAASLLGGLAHYGYSLYTFIDSRLPKDDEQNGSGYTSIFSAQRLSVLLGAIFGGISAGLFASEIFPHATAILLGPLTAAISVLLMFGGIFGLLFTVMVLWKCLAGLCSRTFGEFLANKIARLLGSK